ncbi:helix-turn-helix domain-containing protein [Spirosoma sp. HMF4905]|uniref:Helix-turn-helix domain-containing protein n=1 Tax=Spirosoma arboris TaxID=2682092 RepID=A0A7K1S6C4_9BACT|nr:helix-turn-helix transcriptional regulator [Spirosoma arboris]MVM29363.1 helix-turn-helix domain-containing protein [Spirosoma arboris]
MNIDGPKLFLLLKRKNLTIGQLADQIGVSRRTVSKILNEGIIKTKSHLKLLVQALGITEEELLVDAAIPNKEASEEIIQISKSEYESLREIKDKYQQAEIKRLKEENERLANDSPVSNKS